MRLLFLIPFLIAISFVSASATTIQGPNYDDTKNPATGIGIRTIYPYERIATSTDGNGTHYSPYKLTDSFDKVTVETMQGSFVFYKGSCALDFYNAGFIGNNFPVVGSDSYTVKAQLNGTSNWLNVSTINSASCQTQVIENNGVVSVIGTKSSAGAGSFTLNYTKVPGSPLKVSFSATNNNPSWTNYHIGLTELMQVPQTITLGNISYDLSQYNNTSLNRTWISSHTAQLIKLSDKINFDMGIGWNHVNKITIYWIAGKAYLAIDYTYNTPILQPGNTLTIDPTLTQTISNFYQVKDDPILANTSCPTGTSVNSALWQTYMEPSGSAANYCSVVISKYDISSLPTTLKVTNSSIQFRVLSGSTNPVNCNVNDVNHDPATANAATLWDDALNLSNGTSYISNSNYCTTLTSKDLDLGTSADRDIQNKRGNNTSFFAYATPFTSMTRTGVLHEFDSSTTANTLRITYQTYPPAPTLTHANTLNSTAILLDWSAVTGATSYSVNMTCPVGGTFSQIVNQSGTSYTKTGLTPGTQCAFKVRSTNATGAGSFSPYKSNYTTNIAPTSLAASPGSTTAHITWIGPSGNYSGFKIELQPSGSSWSTIVSNTGNATAHYDLSGLTPIKAYGLRISTNYAVGTNSSGTSSASTILNFTTHSPTTLATVTTTHNVVGDAVQVNATISVQDGYPLPVKLKAVQMYVNGSLYNSTALNQSITAGANYNFTSFWYQFTNGNNQTIGIKAKITNNTGNSGETQITFSASNFTSGRQYNPHYFTAKTSTLGLVNYTISRSSNQATLYLSANRDLGGAIFPMECLYQTSTQAAMGAGGTWVNKTQVGYWYQAQPVSNIQVYYISCYDPGELLFTTSSLVNGSSVLFGIAGFDNTFGVFLGVPVGVFFIVMAAALGNRRTAPMWVVIILAIAGLMATIGFFTLDKNVWYLAIIAGLLGLFVGRKLF